MVLFRSPFGCFQTFSKSIVTPQKNVDVELREEETQLEEILNKIQLSVVL